jgi:hypothetical protein
MDNLFILQLVISFLVGGGFIAFLSFIAEKSSEKVAGMIVSLPSTMVISFFFIGWALSPEAVANIAPLIPMISGIVMIFTVVYLYLSKIKLSKLASMILCTIGSLFVWFLFAVPFAIIEFSNLWISLLGYLILAGIAYYFITIKTHQKSVHTPLKYTLFQKIFRAVFSGFIITLAVFLSKTAGPFWGGIFSGFPSLFLSTLTIFYWHYDSSFLFKIWKNSPLGSIIFVIYSISAIYTFPAFGIWGGTIVSYLISLIVFLVLTKIPRDFKTSIKQS